MLTNIAKRTAASALALSTSACCVVPIQVEEGKAPTYPYTPLRPAATVLHFGS